MARDQKGSKTTYLASTLSLNNAPRKDGVLYYGRLPSQKLGVLRNISGEIFKVFCSIIRFYLTYSAVVNKHDSSMFFSSTQEIFL